MRGRRTTAVACAGLAATAVMTFGVPSAFAEGQNGTTLTVTKTAVAHVTKTFGWTISKTVSPAAWDLFAGDTGTSEYTVSVTKDLGTVKAWVDGKICVINGGAEATQGLAISDDWSTPPPYRSVVGTTTVSVAANPVIDAGKTACYDYAYEVPTGSIVMGQSYKDTANVTITNHSGSLGTPKGPSESAVAVMPQQPTLVNESVDVTDTNGRAWSFSDSGSATYGRTFTKDDEGTNDNTATITETGQSASASVEVNVYRLSVTKIAKTSFDRTWNWSITKTADQTSLTLAPGQQFTVNYLVGVGATSSDDNWAVAGTISVENPAPMAADLTGVIDQFALSGIEVLCPSLTVPSGGSLTCTYTKALSGPTEGANTATVTQQNYSYDSARAATPAGTTAYTGSAVVAWAAPKVIDECVSVSDTFAGALQDPLCVSGLTNGSKVFSYARTLSFPSPGDYAVENTASFLTKDTKVSGSATVTIPVTVPALDKGCTLTQGYWKTHSLRGPAPHDDAWLAVGPAGADTAFYLSGKTYYQVMWTAPAGNVYYNLADQFIAAKINMANGASSPSDVTSALAAAEAFFTTKSPSSVLTKTDKASATAWATTLANYNTGVTGPGHCSE